MVVGDQFLIPWRAIQLSVRFCKKEWQLLYFGVLCPLYTGEQLPLTLNKYPISEYTSMSSSLYRHHPHS